MKISNSATLLQKAGLSNANIFLPAKTKVLYEEIAEEIGSTRYGSKAFNQTVIYSLAVELLHEEVCKKQKVWFRENPYSYFKNKFLTKKSILGIAIKKGKEQAAKWEEDRRKLLEEMDRMWEGDNYKGLKKPAKEKKPPIKPAR